MRTPDSGPLTSREQQVLQLAALGQTDQQIAADLNISHKTVNKHMTTAIGKLNAKSRTQAVAEAIRAGLLEDKNATE